MTVTCNLEESLNELPRCVFDMMKYMDEATNNPIPADEAVPAPSDALDCVPSEAANAPLTPVERGERMLDDFNKLLKARKNKEAWALDEELSGRRMGTFRDTYEPKHPTILVVHASVGSGHRSAAIGIAQALERLRDSGKPAFPDGSPMDPETKIAVIDVLSWGEHEFDGNKTASMFTGITRPYYDITWRFTFTGRLLWGGGTFLNYILWRKYTRFIGHVKPLAVIATHIQGANLSAGARAMCNLDFPIVSVPTDYETEGLWPHKETDVFCVGTESMAETLRARKIPESRIRITGIPTRQDFRNEHDRDATRAELGIPQDCTLAVCLAGAHLPQPYVNMRKIVNDSLSAMASHPNMHLVVVCGKDADYEAQVRSIVARYQLTNVTVMGYTSDMAALMAASDLVLCKAGGLTVTECLCVGSPMVLIGRVYGQEKINMLMLTSHGCATHVTTARELIDTISTLDALPQRLETMAVSANLFKRVNAADDICKIALELAQNTGELDTPRMKHNWFFRLYIGDTPAHTR